MDFKTLYERISPRLRIRAKRIATNHNGHSLFIDDEDLYQEMCIHLWKKFKDGVPAGINEAYIVRGCEFHILNYLRKEREKIRILSLDQPINENGDTLKNVLSNRAESLDRSVDTKITIEHIRNNGLTKREKEVFSLLLEGYTVRETGKELGISHVMVIKYKQRIIKKCQRRGRKRVTRKGGYLLKKVEKSKDI